MREYNVSFDGKNNRFILESEDIVEGSVAVNIPDSDKRKKHFISLFLHKADVEEGIDFLHYISADKPIQINQALFMASLTSMMKCFQTSSACSMISEDRFIKDFPLETIEFYKYKEWRNKHFIHDENSMRQAIAFLFVSPEEAEETLGGLPSVIWNRVPIDFLLEGRRLEILMQALWKFICGEIDKIGQSLLDEYKQKSREELLSFGTAQIKLSTVDSPEKTRN